MDCWQHENMCTRISTKENLQGMRRNGISIIKCKTRFSLLTQEPDMQLSSSRDCLVATEESKEAELEAITNGSTETFFF